MGRTRAGMTRSFRTRCLGRLVVAGGIAMLLVLLAGGSVFASSATVVYKGTGSGKQIALTFDDNTTLTPSVATLRALQANEVPATLFVIGSSVASTPAINAEITKGMNAGLFEVGDHTWSHPVLKGLSASALATQIGGGTDAFHQVTGARTVPLFRPPYGSTDARVAEAAATEGFTHLILWDIDPRDWAGGSAASIANHVISHAHSGAIVVMHMSGPHTAAAVPLIAKALRAKGYEFVKVSTLLKGQRLFLDVAEGTEQGAAIIRMVQAGYMSGYDGNFFGPADTITRAQVAKVASEVGGLHTSDVEGAETPLFTDVLPTRHGDGSYVVYPFDYVQEAARAGLVLGSVDSSGSSVFRPGETITRLQLASILARMLRQLKGYAGAGGSPATTGTTVDSGSTSTTELQPLSFTDVPAYAAADVALVVSLGVMTGYSAGEFGAWAGARRGQVALTMSRYLDLAPSPPAD